ncbi:MAG: hypothetical protein IKW57_04155 [Alphaproteobacteria bacterium]|nr:hypothetical protein [Alphaproteobacteria bacterium]MBR5575057.1 hypothetical protein [Alphaproteobacteria bacterium]
MTDFYCIKLEDCPGKSKSVTKPGTCIRNPEKFPCKFRVLASPTRSEELIIGYLHQLHSMIKGQQR